eukprot:7355345-Pyramimonas_sp.AAC.1
MPATRPVTGSHIASDEDADMATGLEATPADNVPTFAQQSETMRIFSRKDCCDRSCHEDTSQIPTFDNTYTPREFKLQA